LSLQGARGIPENWNTSNFLSQKTGKNFDLFCFLIPPLKQGPMMQGDPNQTMLSCQIAH
jgi:hypothetical protein